MSVCLLWYELHSSGVWHASTSLRAVPCFWFVLYIDVHMSRLRSRGRTSLSAVDPSSRLLRSYSLVQRFPACELHHCYREPYAVHSTDRRVADASSTPPCAHRPPRMAFSHIVPETP